MKTALKSDHSAAAEAADQEPSAVACDRGLREMGNLGVVEGGYDLDGLGTATQPGAGQ